MWYDCSKNIDQNARKSEVFLGFTESRNKMFKCPERLWPCGYFSVQSGSQAVGNAQLTA